jgi:hypothetical protein
MITFVASFVGNRDNDRLAIMSILLGLFVGTQLTRRALPTISSKFVQHPIHRQQQLHVVVPTLLLKVTIACLIAETEFSGMNNYRKVKTKEELDYQFNLFYFLPLGYLFEILVLPLQQKIILHHVFVIAATYFFFWRRQRDSYQATLDLYQIPAFMAIFGIGLFDIGMDGIRLVYYGAFRSKSRIPRILIRGFDQLAWFALLLQWAMIASHIVTRFGPLVGILGSAERVIYPMMLWYWAMMEWFYTVHLSKLAHRFAAMDYGG